MKLSNKRKIAIGALCTLACVCLTTVGCTKTIEGYQSSSQSTTLTELTTKSVSGTKYYGSFESLTANGGYASQFIMARNKPMAGSFYAYTEGVTDDLAGVNGNEGNEGVFHPGSQLVKLTYDGSATPTEEVLIDSPNGVLRDPDISPDGKKIVFSWKASRAQDDYHLYVWDLATEECNQITFGQGISDMEPKWLPNGKIVFSSSRIIQIVDCWKTPVSNLFICNADGSDMIRVGYDQVHTTYPTVTDDGRVLYTRWDYNDRTQMYVQALFSMNSDGTGQTAVFGNNTNNPTTVMHTVGVPGAPDKYLTIVSGHHVVQGGKLAWIDTSVERDGKSPVEYIFEKAEADESFDTLGQSGAIYKYPYAINEYEMLYAKASSWAGAKEETKFNIYYYNSRTKENTLIANNDGNKFSCSQIVPIRSRQMIARPETANYSKTTGTYYVADVYEGDTMKNVERGAVKYLRVVALDYRPYAVGSVSAGKNPTWYPNGYGNSDPSTPVGTANSTWDVKKVIGIVPVEKDGSVMFDCPSDEPVYFQLLDKDGLMIQSMRSWSTLMPGETFSCVGCHENKNLVPLGAGSVTLAMKKGVQRLQKDLWMTTPEYNDYDPYTDYKGFSYANEVQPILDNSCISCHTNVQIANSRLGSSGVTVNLGNPVTSNSWKYLNTNKSESVDGWSSASFNPAWSSASQPFGSDAGSSIKWGASDDACFYMTQKFSLTSAQLAGKFYIKWQYDEDPELYLNGTRIDSVAKGGTYITSTDHFELNSSQKALLKEGENVLTARAYNAKGGSYMFVELDCNLGGSTSVSAPIALTSEIRTASRDKVDYYLSYLVLTGSFLNGSYYVGKPSNNITNWIGGMSEPQTIPAYTYGSTKSNLIKLLFEKHGQIELSPAEIARIAAWIDLGVPYRGSYNEASSNWGPVEMSESERRQNMRDYYTKIDELNKAKLADKWTNKKLVMEYFDKDGSLIGSVSSKHLAVLNLEQKVQPGDKVVIKLPKGVNYIWFNFNPKMKLSLQYCPDGEFSYIVPSYAQYVYPSLIVDAKGQNNQFVYTHSTITAFIPTDEDLKATYNVALNPYDVPYDYAKSGVYSNYADTDGKPSITTGSAWESDGYGNFFPANAFDGYVGNRSHARDGVSDQSWGPDKNAPESAKWLKYDFGRQVKLEYFVLFIRADFPHDAYITELSVEFDDGTTVTYTNLKATNQGQILKLDAPVTCSSIKIKGIKTSKADWCGISEFQAFGTNVIK